jgi:hypothetical protein
MGIFKHKVLAFTLAMLFGVFNVGIPIVVASCPMAAMMQGGRCPMCRYQDDLATPNVGTEQNTPCCATTIVAERNTNEFVQAPSRLLDFALQAIVPGESATPISNHSLVSFVSPVSSSPPVVVDIPILTSSLLI